MIDKSRSRNVPPAEVGLKCSRGPDPSCYTSRSRWLLISTHNHIKPMDNRFRSAVAGIVGLVLAFCYSRPLSAGEVAPRFNRDIRPILSDHCFACHGPDKNQRKADLRLDIRAGAFGTKEEPGPIVPGSLEHSAIWDRVNHADLEQRMPPPGTRPPLRPEQKDLLQRWITAGAPWEEHWSLISPVRPEPPKIADAQWCHSPIDLFIRSRLEREQIHPAPQAEAHIRLRRASLDLNGIPPTLAELEDFVNDRAPDAYERTIDRLLASPRYGERLGIRWLEGARYADTSGYQNDGPRSMWRWRDWVFDAYNHDLPFDRFTVEQIAGDMLPQPTVEQRIASGFNRNHRGNAEGGIIPEEYAVEYVVDRVDTTATVWLALTMGCARCHEHKFDPLTQREFYQLFAYFNNIPEQGRAIKEGNSPPLIVAPTSEDERTRARLRQQLTDAENRAHALRPAMTAAQQQWEASLSNRPLPPQDADWSLDDDLVLRLSFDEPQPVEESQWKIVGPAALTGGLVPRAAGISGQAIDLDGQRFAAVFEGLPASAEKQLVERTSAAPTTEVVDPTGFGYFDRFSISIWVDAAAGHDGTIVSKMTDVEQGDGYALQLVQGRLQFNLVKRWLDDSLRVETESLLTAGEWHHLAVVYDGTRVAKGIAIYVDGVRQPLRVHLDGLNQTFATKEPLRVGGGGGQSMSFHGRLDELRVYARTLDPQEVSLLASPFRLDQVLRQAVSSRSEQDQEKLRQYFLAKVAGPELAQPWQAAVTARRVLEAFERQLPTVMVMDEMPQPRETFVLVRGEYDKHGEPVLPGVPAALQAIDPTRKNDRLAFAEWLVDQRNPLTARVVANRAWQMVFGTGLVRTVEDFGTQGEPPSHGELLDWLAVNLMQPDPGFSQNSPWSQKRLYRTLLLSSTYQQSAAVSAEGLARDAANRWLARGARFRLSAEIIRDQALAASGLLVERVGGPSVKPYQPADLWKELATDNLYETSRGGDLFRRGVYTYWKRTVAPPNLVTFDAAARETCVVRESRTNTPLQALTLLNEITFVEAARNLAQTIMSTHGGAVDEAISDAFRLLTSRAPTPAELGLLVAGWNEHRERFQRDTGAALALIELGESPRDERLDPAQLAAYTTLCSLLLSLDETLTRN